jgi:hypothetical protein
MDARQGKPYFVALAAATLANLGLITVSWAGDISHLDTLTFKSGETEFRAEGIDIEGLNLSNGNLDVFLQGADPVAQAKALASLNATSIKIARLRETQSIAGQTTSTIFSQVSLIDIHNGLAHMLRAASMTVGTSSNVAGTQSGTSGPIEIIDLNLAVLVELGGGGLGKGEFQRVYQSAKIDALQFQSPSTPSIWIDQITVSDVKVRNGNEGFYQLAEKLAKRQQAQPTDPSQDNEEILDAVDVLNSFTIGSIDISGWKLTDPTTPDFFFKISRLGYASDSQGTTSILRVEDADIAADGVKLKLGRAEYGNFAMAPFFEATRKALSRQDGQMKDIDPLAILSLVGRFELRDFQLDISDPHPQSFGARSIYTAVERRPDGSPSSCEISFDGLYGPIPSDATDIATRSLVSLGYHDLTASGDLKLDTEQTSSLVLLSMHLSAQNLASVSLAGKFGNISANSLISNPNSAPLTLLGASLEELTASIENRGIAERLIEQEAVKTKRTPEQVRASYASAAAASLQIYLGMSQNAKTLTRAVVSFMGHPGTLTVMATSKNPAGVTFADTAVVDGPSAILDLFNLDAEAK